MVHRCQCLCPRPRVLQTHSECLQAQLHNSSRHPSRPVVHLHLRHPHAHLYYHPSYNSNWNIFFWYSLSTISLILSTFPLSVCSVSVVSPRQTKDTMEDNRSLSDSVSGTELKHVIGRYLVRVSNSLTCKLARGVYTSNR